MKARVKTTGHIVEVTFSHIIHYNGHDIIWYNTSQGAYFSNEEIEFIDTGDSLDYWTRLEHQYAGMAMQGILGNPAFPKHSQEGYYKKNVVNNAYEYAHTLVEKLKEKEEK